MLVFCEDCGKRHSVTEGGDENGRLQFRCDACGFLITATSVPPKVRKASAPDSAVVLSCSHDELDFGSVPGDEEAGKTLFLASQDGRKVELEVKVLSDLKGNITVERVSTNAFKVRMVAAAKMGADLLTVYDGPAVEFFDTISGALYTIPVVFSRLKPSFALKPDLVDLGKIKTDVLTEGDFVIENCTASPLVVTVTPDPQYFSLTSVFNLISDRNLILAGGEEREILFSVRLSGEAGSAEQFDQIILVTASDNDERPAQKVRVKASLELSNTGLDNE
ncbi:MAG: hypothetical protein ABFS09_05490 [Thermodesulfobacteriota bacterium]